jgi:glucose/arabinose dehydrogenase/type 1 glutamine amidotransferase/PKD repeat protein
MVHGRVLSCWAVKRVYGLAASLLLALAVSLLAGSPAQAQGPAPKVLVFHESAAPHASTPAGIAAIKAIGAAHGFGVDDTADSAAYFTADKLDDYAAVVFLSTNGDVLTPDEESAFQAYIRGGGGFVGIHDAARVEASSSWFTSLVGARPNDQSPTAVQQAIVEVQDKAHPAGRGLPTEWQRSDEWFNWQTNPAGSVNVVANLRERSYADKGTGANGWEHPIAWCRDFNGGRSFYTGMGHTAASFDEPDFRSHLQGAIQWAAGLIRGNCKATIDASYTAERLTAPNAFQGSTPESQLDQIGEPHGLSIAKDGRVFYIGRADKGTSAPTDSWTAPDGFRGWGTVHVWDPSKPAAQRVKLVGTLDVFGDSVGGNELQKKEEGLIGIALDPDFADNHYIWLHYTPYALVDKTKHINTRRISRFTFDEATGKLDMASEKPILQWTYQAHSCCHMGGDMDFDKDGNLYILTGDTNSSGNAGAGYSGNIVGNEFMGVSFNDARRTAGNTNDLNGKILRIKPMANPGSTPGLGTTYTVPAGNLFTGAETEAGKTGPLTRPEIYVMGVRNPTRMWIDRANGWVMTGWVGPDANSADANLGPARYENLAAIDKAGNYGWPYCTGNKQPYRDRNDDRSLAGWYDCDAPKNNSPYNSGLTNLPPVTSANMWYSSQGGGPVHPPLAGQNRPDYGQPATLTEPFLPGGGGQATMPGPLYSYDASSDSPTKFPEFWHHKWFFGDHSRGETLRAVGLDADTVEGHKAPKTAVDVSGIIGKTGAQIMGMEFGPDGNLYVLDYGGGFFSVTGRSALWRVKYTGGAATPGAAPKGVAIGGYKVRFSSAGSGGVSYKWDFGDGQTSTEANPIHTYAEAKQYTAKLTVTYADDATDGANVAVDVLAQADESAPVTTATLNPATPNQPDGTYSRPVTVTLAATDTGGSGVEATEYRVNGGEYEAYTGPITRSLPGDYTIDYRSRDRTGNVEAPAKTVAFKIRVVQNCPTPLNDEFDGQNLDGKWQILRDNPGARSLVDGKLKLLVRTGDMIGNTASAQNVLLQPTPAGSWVVSTKLDVSTLTNSGEQAGLILWNKEGQGANTFAKVVYINKGGTRRFEYVATRNSGQDIQAGPEFTSTPSEVYLRVSSNGSGTMIAESSFDGEQWSQIASPITNLGDPKTLKFGVKISNNADSTHAALFDYFRVDCSDRVPPTSKATVTPDEPDGELGWYKQAPTVTLTADDGELGKVAKIEYRLDGGETKTYSAPFTIGEPGDHTLEYFATDTADVPNTETPKQLGLRVDSLAPVTGATLDPASGGEGPVKVTLDPQDGDAGSGAVRTEYRVDGGPWTTYSSKDEQIFDGTQASLSQWAQAPSGRFDLMSDGSGGITPVGGLGMLWYPVKSYGDFRLKLQFREGRTDGGHSNGGVFVRFPDPRTPLAQRKDDCAKTGSAATSEAWVAIFCGYEIQLYDGETGEPRKTGSVYTFDNNGIDEIGSPKPAGEWEDYEIEVRGQSYKIFRNGQLINEYENTPDKQSDRAGDPDASKRQFAQGYIGLQNHGGADTIQYRDIRVEDLSADAEGQNPTGAFTVSGQGPHTVEFRSLDAAGNQEGKQSVDFEIGRTSPPGPTTPSGSPPPVTTPPLGGLPPMLDTPASYRLGSVPHRISAKQLARRGLKVPVTCTGAMSGSATLTVSRAAARRLGLATRTLKSRSVRCWGAHTATVTLKPSKALARKLAGKGKGPRTVKLRLSVQMLDFGKPAQTIGRTITLKR